MELEQVGQAEATETFGIDQERDRLNAYIERLESQVEMLAERLGPVSRSLPDELLEVNQTPTAPRSFLAGSLSDAADRVTVIADRISRLRDGLDFGL